MPEEKTYICTPRQMKAAEANAVGNGETYIGLMENAGAAAVDEIIRRINIPRTALIICGKGNNGGDGFVMARLLAMKGTAVSVTLPCGEPKTGIAAEEYEKIKSMEKIEFLSPDDTRISAEYDLTADAVFGTGYHGELPENIRELFSRLALKGLVFAADIPSGADSVTGEVSNGTLKCDLTVTFGRIKTGMTLSPAKKFCGETVERRIGITDICFEKIGFVPWLMTDNQAAKVIPERGQDCHKGTFGRALIIAGSRNMSGAAALNVLGALRSGAGLVKLASLPCVIDRVGANIYETTFLELSEKDGVIDRENIGRLTCAAENADVLSIGSGLSCCEDTMETVCSMVRLCGEKNIPVIIDADGLNCIANCIDIIRNANCKAVLTPHPGELARMLGTSVKEIMSDRLSAAARLSSQTGAVVVSKGVPTYIVSPDGRACASYTGNGGLSRGGSGDVLTGVITGICAMNKGQRLFECACSGVYIFGLAADIAAGKLSKSGMLPSDVTAQLPFAFKQVRPETV